MLLPNFEQAEISNSKIVEYLFSSTHPIGRHKAAYFKKFGFDESSVDLFLIEMKKLISMKDCSTISQSTYGTKYVVEGSISTPANDNIQLVTVWFIEKGNSIPYFITAYPGGNRYEGK